MRTAKEIADTARDEAPFSNGSEIHDWMENWCWQCHNPAEVAWQRYENGERKTPPKEYPGGCPLIQQAMIGKTPTEWMKQPGNYLGDQYHCIEYRGPDDGPSGEPRPKPDPPGMDGLFEKPEQQTRMLAPYSTEEVKV